MRSAKPHRDKHIASHEVCDALRWVAVAGAGCRGTNWGKARIRSRPRCFVCILIAAVASGAERGALKGAASTHSDRLVNAPAVPFGIGERGPHRNSLRFPSPSRSGWSRHPRAGAPGSARDSWTRGLTDHRESDEGPIEREGRAEAISRGLKRGSLHPINSNKAPDAIWGWL